ncbi:unnamed protein product [Effrenium voratum]|nr:unnamed protein product [Effrenium voratum]
MFARLLDAVPVGQAACAFFIWQVIIGMRRNITAKPSYPSAFGYCFPKEDVVLLQKVLERTHVSSFTKQVILAGQGAFESWRFLVLVAASCIVIGYGFLFVVWYSFEKMVYGLMVGTHLLLLACCAAFLLASFDPQYNIYMTYFAPEASRIMAWASAGVAFFFWVLFALLCWQGRDALAVTVDSITATCQVIAEMPSMLLQPLLHSVVVVLALIFLVYGFAWILSTGKVVPEGAPLEQGGVQIAGIHRSLQFTQLQWACLAYWIFGVVWIFELLNALGQFAISHAVVSSTVHRDLESYPMLSGYYTGLCFHLGTIALGAFVIGCLKLLAACMSFILNQTRNEHGVQGAVAQVLCCCCVCTVLCIERVLSMVNDLVYTDVALRSCGYLDAADNVVRVVGGLFWASDGKWGLRFEGREAPFVRSFAHFVMGLFNLVLSMLPPQMLRIASRAGGRTLQGSRSDALRLLNECYVQDGIMAPFAVLVLLCYNIWMKTYLGESINDEDFAKSKSLLQWAGERFPKSAVFEFWQTELHVIRTEIREASQCVERVHAVLAQLKLPAIDSFLEQKKAMFSLALLDWPSAAQGFEQSLQVSVQKQRRSYVPTLSYLAGLCRVLSEQSGAANFERVQQYAKMRKRETGPPRMT